MYFLRLTEHDSISTPYIFSWNVFVTGDKLGTIACLQRKPPPRSTAVSTVSMFTFAYQQSRLDMCRFHTPDCRVYIVHVFEHNTITLQTD